MKGLLYRDALNLVRQYRFAMLMILLFLFLGAVPGGNSYMAVYAEVILSTFVGSLLRADETSRWNQYCDILPISRKTVVASYFAVGYLMLSASAILYAVIALCIRFAVKGESAILPTFLQMIVISFLMTAVTIPVTIRFGTQRGPVVKMVLGGMVVAVGLLVLGRGLDTLKGLLSLSAPVIAGGAVILTAAAVLASWLISVKVYESKDWGEM